MDHITEHPEQHDQDVWISRPDDCGTIACFAGWTCLLSGDQAAYDDGAAEIHVTSLVTVHGERWPYDMSVSGRARGLLGLDRARANYLFYSYNDQLPTRVAEIFGPRPVPHADCDFAGQQVRCDRCGAEYVCTPARDFYCTPECDHCCEPCLLKGMGAKEMHVIDLAEPHTVTVVDLDYDDDVPPNAGSAS